MALLNSCLIQSTDAAWELQQAGIDQCFCIITLNERLPDILPGLASMMETAEVSKFYHLLYQLKTQRVQRYLTRLKRVPSRHNFFDCETVLELTHPESEQRVLLMQGDMDVVSDGSRMPIR